MLLRTLAVLIALVLPLGSATFRSGSQTCPSSGTKQLSTTAPTRAIWISLQSPSGNTGVIAFGSQSVTVAAACATASGNCMTASGTAFLPAVSNSSSYDLSQVWFTCTVAGDTIMFNALQ
jgi:hypothetical protein